MSGEDWFRVIVNVEAVALGGHPSNVESHQFSPGIPDINIFMEGVDLWIELKVVRSDGIKMRPTQKKWHRDRAEKGGRSWVLVLAREGDILVVPGDVAATLRPLESAWRRVAEISNIDQLPVLLKSLAERTKHVQHTRYSNRTAQGSGEAGTSLPPSGEDVGGDHWLLDKP